MPQGELISPEEEKWPRGSPKSLLFGAEQDQLKDGSIKVPEVLQKYLGGLEVISRR